jgi:hypothetical protein
MPRFCRRRPSHRRRRFRCRLFRHRPSHRFSHHRHLRRHLYSHSRLRRLLLHRLRPRRPHPNRRRLPCRPTRARLRPRAATRRTHPPASRRPRPAVDRRGEALDRDRRVTARRLAAPAQGRTVRQGPFRSWIKMRSGRSPAQDRAEPGSAPRTPTRARSVKAWSTASSARRKGSRRRHEHCARAPERRLMTLFSSSWGCWRSRAHSSAGWSCTGCRDSTSCVELAGVSPAGRERLSAVALGLLRERPCARE